MKPQLSTALLLTLFSACSRGPSEADRTEASAAHREGLLYVQGREPQKAADELRRAVRLDPGLVEAQFLLGKVLVYLSDVVVGTPTRDHEVLAEAVVALKAAYELDRSRAEYAYWAGRALAFQGEKDEAVTYLEKALRLEPDYGLAYKQLAAVYTEAGEAEPARKNLERAVELLPDDAFVWFRYGTHLEADDDLEGARAAYERAIEIDWTIPGPHSKLATVLQRLGDAEGARKAANDFVHWGDYGRDLKKSLQRANANRDDVEAQLEVGKMYHAARRYESALPFFRRALQIDPANEEAKSALQSTLDEVER